MSVLMDPSIYLLTPCAFPPLIVGVLAVLLGVAVMIRERGSIASVAFCLLTAAAAMWLVSAAALASARAELAAVWWARAKSIGAVFVPSAVYLFTAIVVKRIRRQRIAVLAAIAVSSGLATSIVMNDWLVAGVRRYSWGFYPRYGPLAVVFVVLVVSLMLASLALYHVEAARARLASQRRRLEALRLAFGVACAASVDLLPAFGVPIYPCGFVAVGAFLVLAGTAIWRNRLVELTPAFAAEEILRTMQNVVLVLDDDGVIQVGNEAACRLFGRSESDLLGLPLAAIQADLLTREQIASLMRADSLRGYEVAVPFVDGSLTILEVSASVIRDRLSQPVGIVWIAQDITAHKQAEQQLTQANAQLAEHQAELLRTLESLTGSHRALQAAQLQLIQAAKMESVGQLAAGVAHEVKNPLAIILMGVEYLSKHLDVHRNGTTLVLQDIGYAVRRADSVIRGLLDFSATREVQVAPENLNQILEQSLLLVRHQLTKQHVTITTELALNLPTLRIDRNKMEQLFVNLLMNAIQAMPEGGSIIVRTSAKRLTKAGPETGRRRSDRFHVGDLVVTAEVDDTGPGIPKDKISQIFDPFFTTKPTGQGTGLGLAVSKHIVDLHGGFIEIRNRPEGGARASVTLRADRRHDA